MSYDGFYGDLSTRGTANETLDQITVLKDRVSILSASAEASAINSEVSATTSGIKATDAAASAASALFSKNAAVNAAETATDAATQAKAAADGADEDADRAELARDAAIAAATESQGSADAAALSATTASDAATQTGLDAAHIAADTLIVVAAKDEVLANAGDATDAAERAEASAVRATASETAADGSATVAGEKAAAAAEHNYSAAVNSLAAEAAAGRAEVAAEVVQLSTGIYPSTAAGLAATASGAYFSVPSAEDDEYLILYRNDAGTAVEQKRYPSEQAISSLFDVRDSGEAGGYVLRLVTSTGRVLLSWRTDNTLALRGELVDTVIRNATIANTDFSESEDPLAITDNQGRRLMLVDARGVTVGRDTWSAGHGFTVKDLLGRRVIDLDASGRFVNRTQRLHDIMVRELWSASKVTRPGRNITAFGDSMTAGLIRTSNGLLRSTLPDRRITGQGWGGYKSYEILAQVQAGFDTRLDAGFTTQEWFENNIFLLWCGRNNPGDFGLQDDLMAILDFQPKTADRRYVILGITTSVSEGLGTAAEASYRDILKNNNLSRDLFGERFFDVRQYLVSLNDPATYPEDATTLAADMIPARFYVDAVHFNSTGNAAVCDGIKRFLNARNW